MDIPWFIKYPAIIFFAYQFWKTFHEIAEARAKNRAAEREEDKKAVIYAISCELEAMEERLKKEIKRSCADGKVTE